MTNKSLLTCDKEKTNIFDILFFVLSAILVVFIIGVIIIYATVRPFDIVGDSMEPTFYDGNTVLVDKNYSTPVRGDIVVIKQTSLSSNGTSTNNYIIKRVVAVEGDKIGFVKKDSKIFFYLDDGTGWKKMFEPYTKEYMTYASSSVVFNQSIIPIFDDETKLKNGGYTVIEKDKFFAMGDNRNISADSRKYGQFSVSAIEGKEILVYEQNSFYDFFFSLFFKN